MTATHEFIEYLLFAASNSGDSMVTPMAPHRSGKWQETAKTLEGELLQKAEALEDALQQSEAR